MESNVDELYCISNATKEEPVMAECLRSILLGRLNPSLAPALRSPISQTNVRRPLWGHQAERTNFSLTVQEELEGEIYCAREA